MKSREKVVLMGLIHTVQNVAILIPVDSLAGSLDAVDDVGLCFL